MVGIELGEFDCKKKIICLSYNLNCKKLGASGNVSHKFINFAQCVSNFLIKGIRIKIINL